MSKEKRRVPKLRFPGFTEDWEQRKLGSIGSTYTGLSGKTKEDFGHGEAKYITYLNVFQNTISNITMTDKVEIDPTQNEVKYGDVLFTTSSETPEEVGMSSVWLGDTPNIYLNSFCFGFRPNQKIDSYFLGYSLRAPYMRDRIKILAQGISRYNISKNKVMELEISLPNNEEQKLLGTFLQRIDLIITLHQRKLDNLKLKKKALLQKLFPKNGERYPELRFSGFTDAWEQRKLGEFVKIVSGDAPSTFISGNCIYVKVDDLNYSDRIQLSSSNLVNANPKAHLVNQGATIFPKRGAAIMTNKVRIMGKDGYLDTNMMALIPEEIDKDFLFTFIQKTGLYKIADTSTIPQINNKHIEPYMIQVPSEKEQAYIGVIFKKIDKIITLHQRKLDHLKLQKKALLQQMFV